MYRSYLQSTTPAENLNVSLAVNSPNCSLVENFPNFLVELLAAVLYLWPPDWTTSLMERFSMHVPSQTPSLKTYQVTSQLLLL